MFELVVLMRGYRAMRFELRMVELVVVEMVMMVVVVVEIVRVEMVMKVVVVVVDAVGFLKMKN